MWQALPSSQCQLGESPFWHPQERALYWIDIAARALLRTRGPIASPTIERWALPGEPGCIAPARRGGLVIALRDGIYRAREWGGALALMARAEHDPRTLRFNDGKCDPLGRLWAGTLYEPKDQPLAALYCLAPHGPNGAGAPALRRMAGGAVTGNGLAFAPDARTLYWADTAAHAVRAWDWSAPDNTLSSPRVFAQFPPRPPGWVPGSPAPYEGRPDGASVDAEGRYWVAMYEGAQLLRLSPAGAREAALALPLPCPTMPCFGGDDLRTLFVTSARHGRGADELARWPLAGQVLHARVETPGLPVAFFDD